MEILPKPLLDLDEEQSLPFDAHLIRSLDKLPVREISCFDCTGARELDDGVSASYQPDGSILSSTVLAHAPFDMSLGGRILSRAIQKKSAVYHLSKGGQQYKPMLRPQDIKDHELRIREGKPVVSLSYELKIDPMDLSVTDEDIRFVRAIPVRNWTYEIAGKNIKRSKGSDFEPLLLATSALSNNICREIARENPGHSYRNDEIRPFSSPEKGLNSLKNMGARKLGIYITKTHMINFNTRINDFLPPEARIFRNCNWSDKESAHGRRAYFSNTSERHDGLGLEGYGWGTSPLRRAPDTFKHAVVNYILRGGDASKINPAFVESVIGVFNSSSYLTSLDTD